MKNPKKAIRLMTIVRILAGLMVLATAALYFTNRELAIYPAIAGFALIALVNVPLHIRMALDREKAKKSEKHDQQHRQT